MAGNGNRFGDVTTAGNGRNGDFRFADFEVDVAAHELRRGGVKLHLEVQPFQVLLTLLERSGEVVTRDELKEALWPDDTFVDFDNGVNQAISKIRRKLNDSATRPRFVETIPRVGYRFIGQIDSPTEHQATPERPPPNPDHWVRYASVGLAASLATLLLYGLFNVGPASSPPQVPPRRWTYEVGDLQKGPGRPLLAISPDGRYIAYVAGAGRRLWVQDLNRTSPTALRGTDGAGRFAWSPDSKSIVFAVEGAIRSVAVAGGAPTTLWQDNSVNPSREILWDAAGAMVRFLHREGTLYELPGRGGQPRESSLDREAFLWGPRSAVIAPHLLFVQGFYRFERQIMWRGPSATEPRSLATGWGPSYSSGHIVFESFSPPRGVWAIPFSAADGEAGDPFPLEGALEGSSPSVSTDGTLVFATGPFDGDQLLLLNRRGEVIKTVGSPQQLIGRPEFSPDGKRVAVWGFDYEKGPDIWVHEVDRPSKSRLTSSEGLDSQPVFSPDGTQIAFTSDRAGYGGDLDPPRNLFLRSAGDSKPATLLARNSWVWDWSQNGTYILTFLPGGDIGYLDVSGDGPYEPQRLRATKYREGHAQFSPDGRFVAFQSDDEGRWEIYVCSFPDCLNQKKVSLNGGMYPRWAKKQGSLYYRRGKEDLMEVSIRTQPELAVGVPRRLFSNPHLYQQGVVGTRLYDVSDDGERFVVVQAAASRMSPENPAVIHVWQNWAAVRGGQFGGRALFQSILK